MGFDGVGKISPLKADLLLVLVTLIWGGTFPVLKLLVTVLPPLYLVGMRFLIAFIILTPFAVGKRRALTRRVIYSGITLGLLIWGSFITQTVGIQYTTASKAAFITALCVVLTPILSSVMLRKPPERSAVVGVLAATIGLTLLTVDFTEHFVLQKGDLLLRQHLAHAQLGRQQPVEAEGELAIEKDVHPAPPLLLRGECRDGGHLSLHFLRMP